MNTIDVIIIAVFGGLAILSTTVLIGSLLYYCLGWFKCFYHNILGLHKPDRLKPIEREGIYVYATCKFCGKEITLDNQGNWFVV